MCVSVEDLETLGVKSGLLWWLSLRSFTVSAVRKLRKQCAMELNRVIFC